MKIDRHYYMGENPNTTYLPKGEFLEKILRLVGFAKNKSRSYFHVSSSILSSNKRLERSEILRVSVQSLKKVKEQFINQISICQ